MYLSKKQINSVFIVVLFLALPWIVFLIGYNPVSTAVAPGDGEIYGLQMQFFSKNLKMWNPFLAGGKSQLAEVGSQSLYLPAKIIMTIFPNYFGYNLLLLLHYSFAGYFTFRFLKLLKLCEPSAVLSGVAFMFCGFMVAHKGHNTMVCVASYLPCILFLIEKYFLYERKKELVLTSLIWGLSITADYTACSMYIGMICFPYIILKVMLKHTVKEWKKIALDIIKICSYIFILGTMLASYYLFPILESLQFVTREKITYDFFTGYSFPLMQLGMLIFPSILGGGISETGYFGQWNITELTGYMGLLVLIIAIACVAFAWKKNCMVRFWAIIVFISFLLVLGGQTPFYRIMYKVPIYNMFRVPARNWFELNFAACVLFGYGTNFLIKEDTSFYRLYLMIRKVFIAVIITASVILIGTRILVVLSSLFVVNEYYAEFITLLDQSTKISSRGISTYLIFIFLVGIDIYFLKKYRKKSFFWVLTGCLLVSELFPFAYYHDNIRTEAYCSYPVESKEDDSITNWIKDEYKDESFRIWNVSGIKGLDPVRNQNEEILSISSYGPVWLKDYSELTKFNAAGKLQGIHTLIKNNQLLSMLNTKYIIADRDNSKIIENSSQPMLDTQNMNCIYNWENVNAAIEDQKVTLNAGNHGYSLIQYKLEDVGQLYLKYTYFIEASNLQEGVHVDFYSEDNHEIAVKYYSPEDICEAGGMISDQIILPEGYSNVYIRIFTYSKNDIILQDFDFEDVYTNNNTYVKKLEDENGNIVYENMNAFERAYFVENVLDELPAKKVVSMIQNADADLKRCALTEEKLSQTSFEKGKVVSSYFQDNKIILNVETGNEGFLVLTDNFYPGWKVYADGEESQIYKVNGAQRGVLINGNGKHQVEFLFRPFSFYYGICTSLICMAIIFSSCLQKYLIKIIKKYHYIRKGAES